MPRAKIGNFGWQGASLVAITYVYFLIFAQFAFLKRLASLGVADTHLKAVMGAMAARGILLSLLTPRVSLWPDAGSRLRAGLLASSLAAFLALLPLGFAAALGVSFLIGAGLGLLTVTLVTHLHRWTGNRNPLLAVGAGTGAGYLACNVPPFFTASTEVQACTAGILCLAGIGVSFLSVPAPVKQDETRSVPVPPFRNVLVAFTALVWLDSAAFFIIQNAPLLRAGTWHGTLHLWTNGLLHLAAALASAWLLRRIGMLPVFIGAFVALGAACLLLAQTSHTLAASVLYPIGVSLYSVALVAYPSLLAPAGSTEERGRMAGWIYALAGWTASAMGIGMGQNLGHVPPAFVAAAGIAILFPWFLAAFRARMLEVALTALVLLTAVLLYRHSSGAHAAPQLTAVERGRQVYISEGCIHCHSQYVRPNSADVLMWGPVKPIAEVRREEPPLIGNRRQGPDLSQVGARRWALWLKAHFYNPAGVSGASIMPSYPFLFNDERGDDLVAYLKSLHSAGVERHLAVEQAWQPSAVAMTQANAARSEHLYQRDCSPCHSEDGAERRSWNWDFKHVSPDLAKAQFLYLQTPPSISRQQLITRIAQIAKFGISGTDMPGHEYLSDRDIASISLWLSQDIAQSNVKP